MLHWRYKKAQMFLAKFAYSPVIVHSSRKHSSRLLITANVLCSSSGASKNGKINAPISVYTTTKQHRPGVENIMRNVKCTHRLAGISIFGSLSSICSICDMVFCFVFFVSRLFRLTLSEFSFSSRSDNTLKIKS